MTTTRHLHPAPPAGATGQRVTQARVVHSEWTKLRSVPSTAWSLLAAVVLIVGFGALYCVLRVTRPPDPARGRRRLRPDRGQPDRRPAGPAGHRRPRRAAGRRRVRHRHDPGQPGRGPAAAAGAVGQGHRVRADHAHPVPSRDPGGVPGRPVDPLGRAARHLPAPPGRGQGGVRQRAPPQRRRPPRAGARRPAAQHRRSGRRAVRPAVRAPAPGWPPARRLVGQDLPVPARAGRRRRRQRAARLVALAPWTGFGLFSLYTAVVLALAAWQLRRRDA